MLFYVKNCIFEYTADKIFLVTGLLSETTGPQNGRANRPYAENRTSVWIRRDDGAECPSR